MTIKELKQLVGYLNDQRGPRLDVWRSLRDAVLPDRGVFPDDTATARAELASAKKNYTNRQVLSLRRGAAGLTSAMTPIGLPWFHLGFAVDELEEMPGARAWLDQLEEITDKQIRSSGFYQEIHNANSDLIGFGCMLLYAGMEGEYDAEGVWEQRLRVECCQAGTYLVQCNQYGELEIVARTMRFTVRELADKFGEHNLCTGSQQLLKTRPYAQVVATQVVQRRSQKKPGRADNVNMPFASYWYEERGEKLLHESGYREMPYFFTVWSRGLSAYGLGPADLALPEVRTLQANERQRMEATEMSLRPPVRTPAHFRKRLDLTPGGQNPVASMERDAVTPMYQVNMMGGIAAMQDAIEKIADIIDEMLMGRVFVDPMHESLKNITATATIERRRQMAQLMGPVVASYEPFVLTPFIMRVKSLLDEAHMLPPLPGPLASMGKMPRALLKISYVSPMAQALRQDNADTTRAIVADVGGFAQLAPEVLDKLDLDQAVDEIARGYGVPGSVIRSDMEVEEIRKARAEAQAAQAQQQAAMQGMDMMARTGSISTDNTVAGTVMGANPKGE